MKKELHKALAHLAGCQAKYDDASDRMEEVKMTLTAAKFDLNKAEEAVLEHSGIEEDQEIFIQSDNGTMYQVFKYGRSRGVKKVKVIR